MNNHIQYKNKDYFLEDLYLDENIYRRKIGKNHQDLEYNNFDELIAYVKLLTGDKYFLTNINEYKLITEKERWNPCICGCDNCDSLFIVHHIPSKISFAVGSSCIKKFIPELSSHVSKMKKGEICVLCNEPLYFKNHKNHKKNANKHEYFHCMDCWNK